MDDKYLAIGGLAVQAQRASEIRSDLDDIRNRLNVSDTREIKWSNVKKRRDNAHRAYADYLEAIIADGYAHLHIRFSHMPDYDHSLSGSRKKIDTVSKSYFQLLLHRPGQFYRQNCDLFVYPDKGECTDLLPSFRGHLNAKATATYGKEVGSFRLIEPRDSIADPVLQLLDVTLGAACAIRNERELVGAKRELADHIKPKLPILTTNSVKTERRVSIWNAAPSINTSQRPRS